MDINSDHDPDNEGSLDPEIDPSQVEALMRSLELAERSVDEAVDELRHASTDFNECLRELAPRYPGAIAIGATAWGYPLGPLIVTRSNGLAHMSPVALKQVRNLAWLIARLPEDLLQGFKLQFELELIEAELTADRADRRSS